MLTALITIVGMFTIILVAHNQMLEAMHRDTLDESKQGHKLAHPTSQLHYEESSHSD